MKTYGELLSDFTLDGGNVERLVNVLVRAFQLRKVGRVQTFQAIERLNLVVGNVQFLQINECIKPFDVLFIDNKIANENEK